jgi:hypothetical protein
MGGKPQTSSCSQFRHQQAAEKLETSGEIRKERPSGAKALFIPLALSARLKSCPDTKLAESEISANCQGHPFRVRS